MFCHHVIQPRLCARQPSDVDVNLISTSLNLLQQTAGGPWLLDQDKVMRPGRQVALNAEHGFIIWEAQVGADAERLGGGPSPTAVDGEIVISTDGSSCSIRGSSRPTRTAKLLASSHPGELGRRLGDHDDQGATRRNIATKKAALEKEPATPTRSPLGGGVWQKSVDRSSGLQAHALLRRGQSLADLDGSVRPDENNLYLRRSR